MNELENKIEERYGNRSHWRERKGMSARGRRWTGIFLLLIGTAALLKSYLVPTLPVWLFTWQMLLIVLGLFIGIRHNFRGGPWFVLMLIGSIFLLNEFYPNFIDRRYIWPLALMAVGAFLIFKPRHRHWGMPEQGDTTALPHQEEVQPKELAASDEDFLDSTTVFGGIKKTLFTKNFQGGDIVNILGGTEINLSQADINGRVTLDVTQIFGGTKIIVPPHWEIKPEMAAIFGGIDDKRSFHNATIDHSKVLVLKGTSIFGGIEIRTF
jgi:predicted membrane protein